MNMDRDITIKTQGGRTVEISAAGVIKVDGAIKDTEEGRRLNSMLGALMTSGSFTMMASAGN